MRHNSVAQCDFEEIVKATNHTRLLDDEFTRDSTRANC